MAQARRYLVQTHGCQMNVHDSRRIEEVLRASGYRPADGADDADLMVVNTCSIREKAEHKLMSLLGTLRPWKDGRRDGVLAVAGCVAQQEGDRLLRKARHVDVVIGPDNIPELPRLVDRARDGAPPVARTVFDLDAPEFLVARPHPDRPEVSAYVTTMKGCDERCTYCIVPTTRGPERYRPARQIVDEVARLVAGGVREVTLVGQTVNSWHEPADGPGAESRFPELLRWIARDAPDLRRLRYTSPHPRHLTDALVAAHAELPVLPRHLHLPAQSGSDRVLRRMARRYTAAEYLDRVRRLTDAVPGLTLSTDLIVGFPGETDADFEATLDLVRQAGFVAAFCFKYSPRPFTPALHLEDRDPIPEAVKDERLARLFALVEAQQQAHLRTLVGAPIEVLVEGPNRADPTRFSGRSERHEIVHLDAADPAVWPGVDGADAAGGDGSRDLTGALVRATVVEAFAHSLRARVDAVAHPPLPPAVPAPDAPPPGASPRRHLPLVGAAADS